jgi:hypothetical protein
MFDLSTTWRIAAAAVALAALIPLAFGLARSAGGVDVYLQNVDGTGTRLSVPSQYLSTDAHERGNAVNYVGLTIQASELDLDYETDFHLFITLRAKSPLASTKFSEAVRSQNLKGNAPIDGFELYRASKGNEFMRPKTEQGASDQDRTIFDCGPYVAELSKPLHDRCTGYVSSHDRFDVFYKVPRDHMKEWQSIEQEVLALVETMVADCFEAAFPAQNTAVLQRHACAN